MDKLSEETANEMNKFTSKFRAITTNRIAEYLRKNGHHIPQGVEDEYISEWLMQKSESVVIENNDILSSISNLVWFIKMRHYEESEMYEEASKLLNLFDELNITDKYIQWRYSESKNHYQQI